MRRYLKFSIANALLLVLAMSTMLAWRIDRTDIIRSAHELIVASKKRDSILIELLHFERLGDAGIPVEDVRSDCKNRLTLVSAEIAAIQVELSKK